MNLSNVRTFKQLIDAGVPRSTISARCSRGQYHRLLPSVYALGEPDAHIRCCAVTLWQPLAVVSHRTAGWLHGWFEEPGLIEATVPTRVRVRTPDWLKLYRRDLGPESMSSVRSVPTVTSAQALFDCVSVMQADEVAPILDTQLSRTVDPAVFRELCESDVGRWGRPAVKWHLRHAALMAASEPERILGRTLSVRGFTLEANFSVGPYICDFVDQAARVVIEVDGREFHSEPEVFRNDRRRQNWLIREGWLVLRYAAYDVLADPGSVAEEVIAVIRRRRHGRR